MKVDPRISQAKYDTELRTLRDQRQVLESRGIFILGDPSFPIIDLLYVPRHPLVLGVPVQRQGSIALPPGTMIAVEIPSVAMRAFLARFDLTDYDMQPPSIEFRDPWTRDFLQYATMFKALEFEQGRKEHVVLLDGHPSTGKPFLCVRGVREYHQHPQHSGDDWMLYRSKINLFALVTTLWRVSLDLVHVRIAPQAGGIQVQFVTEPKL